MRTQHERDVMVGRLREVWGGVGANNVKAGREYEVRVAQRKQQEMAESERVEEWERGVRVRGESRWTLPRRVAKHKGKPMSAGVDTHNVFASLDNMDPEPVVKRRRGTGREGRRVCAVAINLAGGRARIAELRRVVESGAMGAEVIAVQETWLKGKEVLSMPGFVYYGRNRRVQGVRGEGGGGYICS